MFYLGRIQNLRVAKLAEHGAYLTFEGVENTSFGELPENETIDSKNILLPKKEAAGLKQNDIVSVFVYKDSSDRPIATVSTPKLLMGEVKRLTVKDVTQIGAFLDWGLVKDLFLPFKEQTYRVKKGDEVLVSLYTDKSGRLCGTMKVYKMLESKSPYKKDDIVNGLCYELIENFGAYIAIDDKYSAMIPKHRLFEKVLPGMTVSAHVAKVLEDGRLELALREKAYMELGTDGEKIYDLLCAAGGFLPYHDKTSPELILAKFGLSKNAFKRAIGHLQKEGKIVISDEGITRVEI
ncbi:MAG: RNA-binding protein [Lachnospiraceae bacterium]|nr:RNA-binding protein [Lachnospiraceae bacterium]